VAKLVASLNPAGAILAAIQGIYSTVMFFIERWDQIKAFCQAMMNSIKAVATGNIDGAKGWIEDSLGNAIPVTLGFLARLIGLGGIAEKIRKVIKKIRKPIDKAINKVVGGVAKKLKKLANKILGKGDKPKPGDAKKIKEENKTEKPDKVDEGDKKKHREVGGKISTKLKSNKIKEKESYEEFHKRVKDEGEALEDKYQPQLNKGINLDVKFKSAKEDKKDQDIDYTIKIAPNTHTETGSIDVDDLEKTKIAYGPLGTAVADPLTSNRKIGTAPGKLDGWEHAQMLNKEHDVWVKGHMVSQELGGLGKPNNMTILNSQTLKRVFFRT